MKRGSVFYWVIGILVAAMAVLAAFYYDGTMQNFIIEHQSRVARNVMRNVSRLGDWTEHFALGAALLAIAWWRGSKRWTHIFLSMLIALAFAGAAARVVKITAGRARPLVKTEQVWNGVKFSSNYNAFPSGHVAASTAFFAVLFLANWRIGLACTPIPILIAFSRMYVAAHYLSDVVCAAILGILCAIVIDRFFLQTIDSRKSAIEN